MQEYKNQKNTNTCTIEVELKGYKKTLKRIDKLIEKAEELNAILKENDKLLTKS